MDEKSALNSITVASKRNRGANKKQYDLWTLALPVFQQHYERLYNAQQLNKFFEILAEEVEYSTGAVARDACRKNIQKWVDFYVEKTGPNNTGGGQLDLVKFTKQHMRTNKEIETLIHHYLPMLGNQKRHRKKAPEKENREPKTTKEALQDVANVQSRGLGMLEESNFFSARRESLTASKRKNLLECLRISSAELKIAKDNQDLEMIDFYNEEIQSVKSAIKDLIYLFLF